MSRGLGQVQRGLLLALARLEVRIAEDAARHQLYYDPPNCLSVNQLVDQAADMELKSYIESRHAEYQPTSELRRVIIELARQTKSNAFSYRHWLEIHLTPSRALALLRKRGLIRNDGGYYYQHVEQTYTGKYGMRSEFISRGRVMLTSAGLTEARRLGLPDSEIIDLEMLTERLQTAEGLSA